MERFGDRRGRFGARLLSFQERASTMFADRVFAVHELHRRRLEDSGVRSDKIDVVMNVADPRLFAPLRRPAENAGPFIITCHGTVTRRLGIDIAIEAVAMLRERIPALRFNIMGGGDYSAEAAALVEKLDLGERIKFPPTVPVEKLPEVLGSTSIGIVPNISNSATNLMLPVKLLDYAALGIPIVAARLQTIEYYFGDGAVAFFEPGNVADLARVIEELYHSPERRLVLARKAQEKLAKIDFASQRTAFYRAVNSLIGSKPTSRADAPVASDMNPSAERATAASISASKQSNVAGQAVMH
jgi:glycosyltransferase involved in cell wall biosynthesis